VPRAAAAFAEALQSFIREQSDLPAWNKVGNKGVWRLLMVRVGRPEGYRRAATGHILAQLPHDEGDEDEPQQPPLDDGAADGERKRKLPPELTDQDARPADKKPKVEADDDELAQAVLQQHAAEGPAAVGSVMLMVQLSPQGVDRTKLEDEVHALARHFVRVARQRGLPLASFSVQLHEGCSNAAPPNTPIEHVRLPILDDADAVAPAQQPTPSADVDGSARCDGGQGVDGSPVASLLTRDVADHAEIVEHMCGLRFRVSPTAFFQVNTGAAEQLYEVAGRWAVGERDAGDSAEGVTAPPAPSTAAARRGERVLLLDVCCGTGTIGLTLAHRVATVLGLELVPSAVADARANAALNKVDNCEFVCGRAEQVLERALHEHLQRPGACYDSVVAIVDPPRGGLHPKVLATLRGCERVRRLVYVSCNQETLLQNAVDLCSPTRLAGEPYAPKKAMAMDLFPHTAHCEAIMLFER